ncbi:MAG: hypothetical protein WC966_08705 [Bradymonadales bacterium]
MLECVPIHGTQLCEPPTAFRFDIRVETKAIPRYPLSLTGTAHSIAP